MFFTLEPIFLFFFLNPVVPRKCAFVWFRDSKMVSAREGYSKYTVEHVNHKRLLHSCDKYMWKVGKEYE